MTVNVKSLCDYAPGRVYFLLKVSSCLRKAGFRPVHYMGGAVKLE